jgi:hypothetical protein
VSEESLDDQPRNPPSPEAVVYEPVENKRGMPTQLRMALDSDSEVHEIPRRDFRGKSPWAPPKKLRECPFTEANPCCAKGTPCYKYFADDVERWRREFLYNSTENIEVTRARLVSHRESNKLPCGKNCCVKFQTYWTGWNNAKLFGRKEPEDPKARPQSVKDVTVIAWFEILKDCLEQMPDQPHYQLNAPLKKDVFK